MKQNENLLRQQMVQLLDQLERESSSKLDWTIQCLEDLPPISLTKYTLEESNRIDDIELANLSKITGLSYKIWEPNNHGNDH